MEDPWHKRPDAFGEPGFGGLLWRGSTPFWLEMTEPTIANLKSGIRRKQLYTRHGYRFLLASTRRWSTLLVEQPLQPLPDHVIVVLVDDEDVRNWWRMFPADAVLDLLLCVHRGCGEEETPPPRFVPYGGMDALRRWRDGNDVEEEEEE